jgi:hypothetical protein
VRCRLGNVHSADGRRDVAEQVVARYHRYFRGDAALANPKVYELLEAQGYNNNTRLPANSVLQITSAGSGSVRWAAHRIRPENARRPDLTDKRTKLERVSAIYVGRAEGCCCAIPTMAMRAGLDDGGIR